MVGDGGKRLPKGRQFYSVGKISNSGKSHDSIWHLKLQIYFTNWHCFNHDDIP